MSKEKQNRTIANFIEKWANASPYSYRDIALVAGFTTADMIYMFMRGERRVPLDCVPALAEALQCDGNELWTLALQQYPSPQIFRAIQEHGHSPNEQAWLNALRTVSGHADPDLTFERSTRLREILLD
ncbi:hypothetical protein RFM68_20955 [Mesorhizobium sp. MSK_1335]|uniref:XRE family transcriptional regulator n=1 Tax=Mesorhizobium montanum TaxID=3072323 RepID=A0ABU4ZPQ3_9HYPH|nr:hypothetical protein [Mesorhizobium sp. MSK_1335]MDX8526975.1 hypothetical protein [Mesorhizobium sp. MSK_1335]